MHTALPEERRKLWQGEETAIRMPAPTKADGFSNEMTFT